MIDAIMEAEVIAYMIQAQAVAPVDDYMVEPVDDAGIVEPLFQGGPVWREDPIPAIPLQEIPLEEAGNMVRPRTRANPNPQEPDLASVVATLQQQLLEQQQETNRLREQIAQLNQIPQANVVPPQENPVPPVVPQVLEVHQEIPWNAEVPLAPARVQANPPLIREDLLYERFRRMKAPEFEGLADPIEADN
ncbi:hypothetical protein TIFTF001_038034 [Ficus carica]|uniref:Uncharacterized protein n=1 Tax=Ficus carica TaxID=3494 RepID=A0AA88E7C0_FICCA|nr:hypothetical protein TIFTF001_038034 [Ficus carica]